MWKYVKVRVGEGILLDFVSPTFRTWDYLCGNFVIALGHKNKKKHTYTQKMFVVGVVYAR